MLIWQAAIDGREHRHHERADPLAALLEEDPLAERHVADPAAAGVDHHRDVVAVGVGDLEARRPSIACAAAATASWLKRLMRRACLKSIQVAGSKPLTSAAICTSSADGS